MFCRKCGKQIEDNAKFCIACGQPVEAQQPVNNQAAFAQPTATQVIYEQPVVSQEAVVQQSVMAQPVYQQQPVQQIETKKSAPKKIPFIIGAAVIVLAIAATVIYFAITGTPENKIKSAIRNTADMFKNSDNILNQELGLNDILDKVENDTMCHSLEFIADYQPFKAEIYTDIKNSKYKVKILPDIIPITSLDLYVDKENLMVGCMDLLNKYLYINYEDFTENFKDSALAGLFEMGAGSLIGKNGGYADYGRESAASNSDSYFDIFPALMDSSKELVDGFVENYKDSEAEFLETITYEEYDSKRFSLGSKNIECDGYKITIALDDVLQLVRKNVEYFDDNTEFNKLINDFFGYDQRIKAEMDSFYDEMDEVLSEVKEYFPENIEIYVYINDGYIVNANTEIGVMVYGDIQKIEFDISMLGENNPLDDFELNLTLNDRYDGVDIIAKFDNLSDKDDISQEKAFDFELTEYGRTQRIQGKLAYDRDTDEFTIYAENNSYDEYYEDTDSDYFYVNGSFTDIDKGNSFTLTIQEMYGSGIRDRLGTPVYHIEPCGEVEPFVDYEDAVNVLDIDESLINTLVYNLFRLDQNIR